MSEIAEQPIPQEGKKVSPVVEKVQTRIKDFSEQKHKGAYVEQKWMAAYERALSTLDEGKRKQAVEKMRPVAEAVAKFNKVGAGVADFALRCVGVLELGTGVFDVVFPGVHRLGSQIASDIGATINNTATRNITTGEIRRGGLGNIVTGAAETAVGKVSGVEFASGFLADIAGKGTEKIIQIENKILKKFTKPPMPVKA